MHHRADATAKAESGIVSNNENKDGYTEGHRKKCDY